MFEIPDDDEDFWESLPMDDITNVSESGMTGQKRHGSEGENVTKKKLRTATEPTHQREKSNATSHIIHDSHSTLSSNFQFDHEGKSSRSFAEGATNNEHCHVGTIQDRHKNIRSMSDHAKQSTSVRLNCQGSDVQDNDGDKMAHMEYHLNGNMPCHYERYEHSDTAIPNYVDRSTGSVQDRPPLPQSFVSPGTRQVNQDKTPKHKKRKFPGPAGLLPRLHPGQSLEKVMIPGMSPQTRTEPPDESIMLSSQSSDDMFSDTPWCCLLDDLQHHRHHVLDSFSVSSSLQKASKKLLPDGKITLMLAVVESVDIQGPDACVVLKDRTAKVSGTMHRDAVKEYAADLHPGVALVLKQVSVVSPTCRTHYLNITSKNIVHLYGHRLSRSESSISDLRKTLHNVVQAANSQPTIQPPVTPNPRRTSPELAKTSGDITPFRPPQMSTPRSQFTGQSTKTMPSPRTCQLQGGNLSNNQTSTPTRKFNFKSVNSPNSPVLGASPVLPRTVNHRDNRPSFSQTLGPNISTSNTPYRGQPSDKSNMDTSCGKTSASLTGAMRPQFNIDRTNTQTVLGKAASTGKQNNDADLWQDDFSDELLSQLSEDMF